MNIYMAALFILVPVVLAIAIVLAKTVVTETRKIKRLPIQMSLPREHDERHDERLTRVG